MSILERHVTGAVVRLHMNAPERLNALSDEMIAALQSAFDEVSEDPALRVVVISAAGKAFCAGHDLKQMTAARQSEDGGVAAWKDLFDRCATMMQTIQKMPQPVIARVHGLATAAGCQLVASCDMAVAAREANFGVNGVNIGLFCSTPMVALLAQHSTKKSVRDAYHRPIHKRRAGGSSGPCETGWCRQISSTRKPTICPPCWPPSSDPRSRSANRPFMSKSRCPSMKPTAIQARSWSRI